jgi:hypothetical protein
VALNTPEVAVKKKWLVLPLGAALATLAVVALLVGFAAEDARQAALLDARVRDAEERYMQTSDHTGGLHQNGAPLEELYQADWEEHEARMRLQALLDERDQRQQSWHARLRREVRRRTGW